MRIVLKFQQGNQVNRLPRYVVGHPYLTLGDANSLYKRLSYLYNLYSGIDEYEKNNKKIGRASIPNSNNYIKREIRYNLDWVPNDTIYTEVARVFKEPTQGQNRDQFDSPMFPVYPIGLAGVVHSNNYDKSWPYTTHGAPRIVNGEILYYDYNTDLYTPADKLKTSLY